MKINNFKFKCNNIEFNIEAPLDEWNDIKFDAWLYLKDIELYNLLQNFIDGYELTIVGTDFNNNIYEEKVIKEFPEKIIVDNMSIPHIVLFCLLDYIDKVVGWGSVINVKTKKINYLSDMSEAKREDVYYLGKFCRKLNSSSYYDKYIWENFHYYIENK